MGREGNLRKRKGGHIIPEVVPHSRSLSNPESTTPWHVFRELLHAGSHRQSEAASLTGQHQITFCEVLKPGNLSQTLIKEGIVSPMHPSQGGLWTPRCQIPASSNLLPL